MRIFGRRIPHPLWLFGPTLMYVIGAAMNYIVCAFNHGQMPVQYPGGCDGVFATATADPFHSCLDAHSRLRVLTDWIQGGTSIYSPGDLLILGGLSIFWVCLVVWIVLRIEEHNASPNY